MKKKNKLFPIVKLWNLLHENKSIKLTLTQRAIIYELAGYANNETLICYPSINQLAIKLNCSKNTIKCNLKSLEQKKYISVVRTRNDKGSYINNVYQLDILSQKTLTKGVGLQLTHPRPPIDPGVGLQLTPNYLSKTNDITMSTSYSCTELENSSMQTAVIIIPLNNKSEYPITHEMVNEWSNLYPAVEIMQSLRNIRGWCLANPTRCKTNKGIKRFINAWLMKDQDQPKRLEYKNYVKLPPAAKYIQEYIDEERRKIQSNGIDEKSFFTFDNDLR